MSEHPLYYSFQEFVRKHRLIRHGEKILVSVSGGIDSLVLLDLLSTLRHQLKLELAVTHFNHQLRSTASDADEAFVRSIAKERKLVCYVETADTRRISEQDKLSLQESARNLRYAFFTRVRQSTGFDTIATAHNADDNAETILMNLFRGTGVHGMTGIPLLRKDLFIIRPLLFAPRESIQHYSTSRGIQYREDSSNLKSDYTRNFIRHKLLPLIRKNINPNLTAVLGRTNQLFNQLEEYIDIETRKIFDELVKNKSEKEIRINLPFFKEQPMFIREHLLLNLGREFAGTEIDFNTVNAMLAISQSETGSYCSISKDAVLHHDRKNLIFRHVFSPARFSYSIHSEQSYKFDTFAFSITSVPSAELSDDRNIEFINADALGLGLTLRSWIDGDWFIPLGRREKKKISDFFIDQKIPLFEKESIPILLSDGKIVWVCGKRLDERYKITPKTKNILRLEYIPRF